MRVQVRGRNIEVTEALRAHAERRLQFSLARFGDRVGRVVVRLADVNGSRGGVDKSCRIQVGIRPRGSVRVEDADADLYVAIDRASDRVGRAVAREVERGREIEASAPATRRRET